MVCLHRQRLKNGRSKEVAQASRDSFEREYPSSVVEQVQVSINEKGWALIWTPPYIPSSQPIEPNWAYANAHVSLEFKKVRNFDEVCHQIRQGRKGGKDWPDRKAV